MSGAEWWLLLWPISGAIGGYFWHQALREFESKQMWGGFTQPLSFLMLVFMGPLGLLIGWVDRKRSP